MTNCKLPSNWERPPIPPGAILYGTKNQEYAIANKIEPQIIPEYWIKFLLKFFFILTSEGAI